jgi:hypothetical protein
MHKQSAIEDGLVQLMIDVEGYGLLELTITQRLGQSVAAQARTQSQGEESADERWVWQRAPLFVGQDPPTDLTNEPDQDAAAEIDLTESVMGDPLPVIDLREPAKRSPLAMVALGVVGLLVGFGVVSQLSSDSTPDDDQAVEVAGITTTPGVVTTVPGSCHENYGSCVPIAEDVDCEGGLGDGPAFVKGPIDLVGEDVYLLDTDKDGIACGSTDRPEDEVFDGN